MLSNECSTGSKNSKFISVLSRFEKQVLEQPDAIAVVDNDNFMTYQTLNENANRLAHHLISEGLKPGALVGLCVDRSSAIVVGILAILKAGAGYVPIDMQGPQERSMYIRNNSKVGFIVTDVKDLYFESINVTYINDERMVEKSKQNPGLYVTGDNTAYVIYTSGTTGKPNGVIVSHRNLARLFDATDSTFNFGRHDVWTLFHSYAFDFSVWEMWGALIYGGKLIVVPYWVSRSPKEFYDILVEHDVTVLNQTPTAFKQLMPVDKIYSSALSLRYVIFGGEALNPVDLKAWASRHLKNNVALFNMYGITETTVHVSCYRLSEQDFEHSKSIIGQQISDLSLYILNDNLEPVAFGETGQMYIGGPGVTAGYLNNKTLTDERFIEHSLAGSVGKLYKTGDLARRIENQNIEFIGRVDEQVSLRGFRIEMGEVETELSKIPGVIAAISMVELFDSGDQLVAYIIADGKLSNREIRKSLSYRLPAYMIPSFIYRVAEIPLNINGKVDKPRLAEMRHHTSDYEGSVELFEAKSETEAKFCEQWRKLLEVEEIFENDNFFELGGHSLLATQLIYKINEIFNITIDIRDLFDLTFKQLVTMIGNPASEVQRFILGICAELLEDEVGLSDNFFELGGHSLMATRFSYLVRNKYGCDVDIRMLFDKNFDYIAKYINEYTDTKLPNYQAIARRKNCDEVPLSFSQQRLWFLNKMEEKGSNYNVAVMFNLEGKIDKNLLTKSINNVIARHEDLRTSFKENSKGPYQYVADELILELDVIKLESGTENTKELIAYQTANELNAIPFDLSQGPLLRPHLIYLDEDHSILLLSIHHTIIDGWSVGVLIREIKAFYEAGIDNAICHLPELAIQYRDYTQWQLECFENNKYDGQLSYWREHLDGMPPLLSLPLDYPRPIVQSYRGAAVATHIPKKLLKKLEALGKSRGSTMFMTLISGFKVLLHNYTRQSDIAIGTPIANRTKSEIENSIGFFTNTLVIRSQIEPSKTFSEFLDSVKHHVINAYENQDVPFERVVDALQPERSLSFSPLFQVLFVLQNTPFKNELIADIQVSEIKLGQKGYGAAKFDLMIDIEESADGLDCEFVYNTDLFLPNTIERMAANYLVLLEALAETPELPLSRLNLLTEHEKDIVINHRNDTAYKNPQMDCVHRLVEKQVVKTPDNIAVSFFDKSLSYTELNEKANQVADYLITQGVGPEVRVALCIERSLELIICVLGILKAGGAYVGLDPEYPRERLNNMILDADAHVLLADTCLLNKLESLPSAVIDVKSIFDSAGWSKENPDVDVHVDNLMTVLYTSGTTGRPKGIAIPHCSWINVLDWHYQTVSKGAHFLQFFSVSTDSFFTEMFTTLCSGGRLHMIPESLRFDSKPLLEHLHKQKVDKVNLPVVVLQQWATEHRNDLQLFEHFRDISTTGEQLQITGPIVELFKNALPNCRLHNHYGPTETHASTYCTFEGDPETWPSHAPIGKPFINCKNYILNDEMSPVPIGASGELYIGGSQLARGYLNRPDATAEKFVPNPFGNDPLERLYRTGDLCRYLPDGKIEYIERIDNVVKVRGFRIELEEVEAAINQHPQIHRAVVLVKGDVASEKRLVAYMVAANKEGISVSSLYDYLKARLADFKIPSAFVFMDEFPLNPNKKVDKKALPEPQVASYSLNTEFVEPQTVAEIFVANLWQKVLKLNKVGIHDNFFQLGGHSLLCAQLVNRINTILDAGLTVVDVLATPTVFGMLKRLEAVFGSQDTLREVIIAWNEIEEMSEQDVERALALQ